MIHKLAKAKTWLRLFKSASRFTDLLKWSDLNPKSCVSHPYFASWTFTCTFMLLSIGCLLFILIFVCILHHIELFHCVFYLLSLLILLHTVRLRWQIVKNHLLASGDHLKAEHVLSPVHRHVCPSITAFSVFPAGLALPSQIHSFWHKFLFTRAAHLRVIICICQFSGSRPETGSAHTVTPCASVGGATCAGPPAARRPPLIYNLLLYCHREEHSQACGDATEIH